MGRLAFDHFCSAASRLLDRCSNCSVAIANSVSKKVSVAGTYTRHEPAAPDPEDNNMLLAETVEAPALAVRIEGAARLTSLTVQMIEDFVREGKFPRPVKIGHRTRLWSVAVLRKWIDDQQAMLAVA